MKTAVVLSGGGAKGAYQMGVWKALRKMHIKYNIVTGTSIGAMNGVLMVQNNYYRALNIWKNITYQDVCGKEFEDTKELNSDINVYKNYVKAFFADGGMSSESFERLFGTIINCWRFKHSKVDYGMVTFNISTMKHLQITKKDLNEKNIRDYVIASASCYPAFKAKTIDNQRYIDGGYYDNLPINLAIEMGADKVIAVDLRAPGIKKTVTDKSVEVIRIYPRNKIVSFLVFDKELSKRAIQFGYNDTMKTFGKLDGNKYTFKKGNLNKNYLKYRSNMFENVQILANYDNTMLNAIMKFNDVDSILKNRDFSKLHNDIVEYLGKEFQFDESIIYEMNNYNKALLQEVDCIGKIDRMSEKTMLNTKLVIIYIYTLLSADKLNIKKICKIMLMFKKEFMGALYLKSIEK